MYRAMIKYFTFFSCLFLITGLAVDAQQDVVKNPEQFVFPDFSVGVVKLKNMEKIPLALNYNVVTGKMVFMQKNQIFDMIRYSNVDTVYIHERKFVPFDNVFYEVLINESVSLFIQHKGEITQPPRPAAYGGTSQLSSTTYITNLRMGNDVYRLKNDESLEIDPVPVIWIRKDNTMYTVSNRRSLLKIFSDRKNEMKEFINRNRINTENPGDLIRTVNFYNDLIQEKRP